jgi:hypothetical protein
MSEAESLEDLSVDDFRRRRSHDRWAGHTGSSAAVDDGAQIVETPHGQHLERPERQPEPEADHAG